MNIPTVLILLLLTLIDSVSVNKCNSYTDVNQHYYDSCEQRCECKLKSGVYKTKCYREREDYACMSPERRQRLHQAILDVSNPSDPLYPTVKAFIEKHGTGFAIVHVDRWFLHFHRAYQQEFENILRQKDCRITLPYWSFSQRPFDPFPYLPFTAQGMGDSGDCVINGPFASWIPADKTTCLARNFEQPPVLPTLTQLNQIFSLAGSDFLELANQLQYSYHNGVHVTIGGDATTARSPNDPLFFLLHGNIDRVWDLYQNMDSQYFNNYPFADDPIPFTNGVRPSDVNSLEASGIRYVNSTCAHVQNGSSCYSVSKVERACLNTPLNKLLSIRQNAPRTLTGSQQTKWLRMMATNKTQRLVIKRGLQKSKSQCEALTNSLSEIVNEPLFLGIDTNQFVTSFDIVPDGYAMNGGCGYQSAAPSSVYVQTLYPTPYQLTSYPTPQPWVYVPSPTREPIWYSPPPSHEPTPYPTRKNIIVQPTTEYHTLYPTAYKRTMYPTPVSRPTPKPTSYSSPPSRYTWPSSLPPSFHISWPSSPSPRPPSFRIFWPTQPRTLPPSFSVNIPVSQTTPILTLPSIPPRLTINNINNVLRPTPSLPIITRFNPSETSEPIQRPGTLNFNING